MATWFRGRDAVAVFLRDWAFAHPWQEGEAAFRGDADERGVRLVPTTANGQLAYASYRWDPSPRRLRPDGASGPHAARPRDRRHHRLCDALGLFPYFGLPDVLAAQGVRGHAT